MATRPSLDETMMAIAQVLSRRATCVKRQVGCVLTNDNGHILSTGYNGVPAGFPHCTDVPCPGASDNAGSDTCMGVHAANMAKRPGMTKRGIANDAIKPDGWVGPEMAIAAILARAIDGDQTFTG